MKTPLGIFILCAALSCSTATVLAQNSAGSLTGTVADPSGSSVDKAKVVARQDSTGRQFETTTTSEGLYVFPNLDVGSYTLIVEQSGFKKLTRPNVVISISNRTVADLKLEVGDLTQTVTVTSDAPLLQTTTSEVGSSLPPKLFRDARSLPVGCATPRTSWPIRQGLSTGPAPRAASLAGCAGRKRF